MGLEERLKELERQLALKKAYESVNISFPKNSSLPKDVREEVKENIRTFCGEMAKRIDATAEADNKPKGQQLSDSQKNPTQGAESATQAAEQQSKPEQPLKATLMTTDNLPQNVKKLVDSNAEVRVMGLNGQDEALIQIPTRNGPQRANVPKEDLELIE